ncbi:PREDICTED: probable inactive receptor [Prunus dulcis]|uniref:PREDICTED: probable inactive receptor n=1 Tax=Prunus dulcis TaxID=3755 RepID=A0A5E4FIA9_PRUDU|nr:probable inactive receptor kinase At1g48480 [Prunus dulcis]VVA27757.1 PREDICTED: probable inactive receptor [Prunus dulcis]
MKSPKQRNMVFTTLLLIYSLGLCLIASSDLAADREALLALRTAVKGRSMEWNVTGTNPCLWPGVECESGRVTKLRLPGRALVGQLPLGLGNLTQLSTLSLRLNALSGQVPNDLVNLVNLKSLYLQGNSFSGPIPEFLFNMQSLTRLSLAKNKFSGEISPGFNNLTSLVTLHLEENQLTGSIPELGLALEQFNVSSNQLNGSIPSKLSDWPENAFQGNLLCGKPLKACNGTENTGKKNKLSGGAIAGIVIGCIFGLFFIIAIVIFLCKRNKNGEEGTEYVAPAKVREVETASGKTGVDSESLSTDFSAASKGNVKSGGGSKSLVFFGDAVKVFDLEDLLRASAEVLGKGTFGTTYKAALELGVSMAVKRLKEVTVSEKVFRENIEEIGGMDHVNLVPLRAYYYSRDEKLLVYDYMPMGSLSALLHGNRGAGRTPLNWETRSGIAVGAARAITYLHSHGPTISHGNIKSSNILLTRSFEACVSDFCLAHLASPTSTPNRISGYRAPELTDASKVTQKADVYSFGVLLLELLTGKAPTQAIMNEEGVDLPRWVHSVVREEWTVEVFDLELLRYQNVEEDMVQLLQIALECTVQHPDNRPLMGDVTSRIEELYSASLKHGQDANPDISRDVDDGLSQQHFSADSHIRP